MSRGEWMEIGARYGTGDHDARQALWPHLVEDDAPWDEAERIGSCVRAATAEDLRTLRLVTGG